MDFSSSEVKVELLGPDKVVPFKNLKLLDPVDPGQFYSVVVQLGEMACWGPVAGSKKTIVHPRKNPNDKNEKFKFEHVVLAYAIRPVPGDEVNGMISSSKKWLDHNQSQDSRMGEFQQMRFLTSATPINYMPPTMVGIGGQLPIEVLKSWINEQIQLGISNASVTKSPAAQKSQKSALDPATPA